METIDSSDDLAPARGMVLALIFSLVFFWAPSMAIMYVWGHHACHAAQS